MAALYKKNNKYSIHAMRESTLVDLADETYNGLILLDTANSTGFEIQTLAGDIFKITDDNFDIIMRTATMKNGRLIGNFTWQTYKNKWLFLPEGLLDDKPLQYGDIVVPVITRHYFGPSEMIYLGVKDIVEYDQFLIKRVKKQVHIFVGLDDTSKNQVYDFQTITSAYFKKSSNISLADEYHGKLNTNNLPNMWTWFNRKHRTFYVDNFAKTKIKPILVKITHNNQISIKQSVQTDAHVVIINQGKFYKTAMSNLNNNQTNSIAAIEIRPIDVVDDEDIRVDINYFFQPTKYIISSKVILSNISSPEPYAVVYELYQNGVLIGRK